MKIHLNQLRSTVALIATIAIFASCAKQEGAGKADSTSADSGLHIAAKMAHAHPPPPPPPGPVIGGHNNAILDGGGAPHSATFTNIDLGGALNTSGFIAIADDLDGWDQNLMNAGQAFNLPNEGATYVITPLVMDAQGIHAMNIVTLDNHTFACRFPNAAGQIIQITVTAN